MVTVIPLTNALRFCFVACMTLIDNHSLHQLDPLTTSVSRPEPRCNYKHGFLEISISCHLSSGCQIAITSAGTTCPKWENIYICRVNESAVQKMTSNGFLMKKIGKTVYTGQRAVDAASFAMDRLWSLKRKFLFGFSPTAILGQLSLGSPKPNFALSQFQCDFEEKETARHHPDDAPSVLLSLSVPGRLNIALIINGPTDPDRDKQDSTKSSVDLLPARFVAPSATYAINLRYRVPQYPTFDTNTLHFEPIFQR
ncbi:hypothetical protein BKA70DRAFT_1472241 [Coprinopsis sp. MPI-PUGE-AT-0042]|nr:hypothetical protein BKA70DRAFT_1472241 [Coprinopsis sp. MPI-PUGE-AT-0042]